jgi:polyphosphate kinase
MTKKLPLINREISWLSFNERVLQEAMDKSNPIIERLRFLGIFSNNLDEFFRVRVASVKRMIKHGKGLKQLLNDNPSDILEQINAIVLEHQEKFEQVFEEVKNELAQQDVYFINEKELSEKQGKFVRKFFKENVRQALVPLILDSKRPFPEVKGKSIYLAIKLYNDLLDTDVMYALIEIPTKDVGRFILLPSDDNKKYIILLDDVIRFCLDDVFDIFNFKHFDAYTIKFTRDAELDIDDDDITESIVERLEKSLKNRKKGEPVRFIYDAKMPYDLLNFIITKNDITKEDTIIPGGRYHNFKDFMQFPDIGLPNSTFKPLKPLEHAFIESKRNIFEAVFEKDILLAYPFQRFDYIIELLSEAAMHPKVSSIKINIYRLANRSKIVNALINAAKNGKKVTAVIELQARFDEGNNIKWAEILQENGVKVIFGVPGLKVHSKLILITLKENGKTIRIAHIGTGNFHEGTAKIYTDLSLLTADSVITNEVNKVFRFFKTNYERSLYRKLLVSPFNVRRRLNLLINREIKNAKQGNPAYIILKLNNLVDEEMIKKLYEASNAGVKITLIIRGICSLVPGVKGWSENIHAISIVGRFLEHSRVMIFGNNGNEEVYITSADWMHRNLSLRVEVGTPVQDKEIAQEIRKLIDMQLKDDDKARIIDAEQKNCYVNDKNGTYNSQIEIYTYFKSKLKEQVQKTE